MKPFNQYFDNVSLVKLVVKYRISLASKRHDFHFFNDLRQIHLYSCPIQSTKKSVDDIIFEIVPGRRSWLRIGKDRKNYKNSTAQNSATLEKTIYLHKKKVAKKTTKPDEWYISLCKYFDEIRGVFKEVDTYLVGKPIIIPEKKKTGKTPEDKADKAHRPLAHFRLFRDKILIGQAAKYLTDVIDAELCNEAAFAFRSRLERKEGITHHDAIAKIQEFIKNNQDKNLWVAECDIKKFYDCVNHTLAKECLSKIIARVEARSIKVDQKAIKIFNAYLGAYAFNIDVEPLNTIQENIDRNIEFGWERDNLIKAFYAEGITDRIGVPQGGAISCLIANIMMDEVDREVLQIEKRPDENLLYVRYCDDMVIIHTEESGCNAALQRYQEALKKVKLLCHPPIAVNSYGKDYFEAKSKLPYRLSEVEEGVFSAPWLAFVGYQVKYNGDIRIRKKSLAKELEKQNLIVHKAIKAIRYKDKKDLQKNARRSAGQIKFRVEQRLISMSVGRVCLYNYSKNRLPQLSWTVGFKKLNKNSIIEKQLRQLDRNRTKNLKKLSQKLRGLKIDNNGKPVDEGYFGSPFSYHNFILHK
ncbi:MAG: reverse transcriptase domain-containing protein [Bacteroidia bacterium]